VGVISFTGSTAVGQRILALAGQRLARISLELGGKNPFVVCEDADLPKAVEWAAQSAFSNAGQRCASGSRIIVVEAVYEKFRALFLERTAAMRVGNQDTDDFGPVINERQLGRMLQAIEAAKSRGVKVLVGGQRLSDGTYQGGSYLAATVLEGASPADPVSREELFGPITCLYRVRDFAAALALANDSPYGLTAAIHTANFHRAMRFCEEIESGVVTVNGGTFGSEPHMPFGGRKLSGNGSREPGTEALDVYSELKDVYLNIYPEGAQ
jgi:aldehyde dehydrogenase (NAD+)